MSYAVEFAKELKNRDNPDVDEAVIGDIIEINPVTVSLFNGQAIFTEGVNCYVCEILRGIKGTITIDDIPGIGAVTSTCTISRTLKKGDKVLCIPTANGNKYFIKDKVEG